jgi:CheY-like chemotaxis protein
LLEHGGHEVHEAADGTEGVELALCLRPDAVLIDIGLPGLDGYEVARQLKAKEPGVRLIALTGYGQPDDRRRGAAAGFDAYLIKPVEFEALAEVLTQEGPPPAPK